ATADDCELRSVLTSRNNALSREWVSSRTASSAQSAPPAVRQWRGVGGRTHPGGAKGLDVSVEVVSPVSGLAAPLSEVPDPIFSQAMVGPGVAVKPHGERADACAPIAGTVATLHPHAFVIVSASGAAVLVHLGIDTVRLEGA